MANKIEIDLDNLESEISDFDRVIENATKVIDDATREKFLKVQLRDYIISQYAPQIDHRKPRSILADSNLMDVAKHVNESREIGKPTGIGTKI